MSAHNADAHLSFGTLGRGGPVVSQMTLGTMTFGAETDEQEAFKQLDLYRDHGGNFIDTADTYASGLSEEIIGRWRRERVGSEDMIFATKGRFAPPKGSHGGSRRGIFRSVDRSLSRLQIDVIDLYYIHGWDRDTDVAETLSALADLVSAGKIHNIGWSNLAGWQLQKVLTTAEAYGYPRPVVLQPQYNLLDRGIELEVIPCCLEAGLSLAPWSPLGGGWLTGKYSPDTFPIGATRLGENPHRGVEAYASRNVPDTHAILATLAVVAERYDRPLSHIALAWLASRPAVKTVILGARSSEQLRENLAAANLKLHADDLEKLTLASSKGIPAYPYGFLQDWSEIDVWKKLGT